MEEEVYEQAGWQDSQLAELAVLEKVSESTDTGRGPVSGRWPSFENLAA